jgi:hypothetical protein
MIKISEIKNAKQRAVFRRAAGPVPAPPPKAKALLRPTTDEDGLNRTERMWLRVLHAKGCYAQVRTQAVTLKIGFDTRYTPDFQTTDHAGEITFWEVKGFFRDDAKVKIKVAARLFNEFKFVLVFKKGKGWITEEVKP